MRKELKKDPAMRKEIERAERLAHKKGKYRKAKNVAKKGNIKKTFKNRKKGK